MKTKVIKQGNTYPFGGGAWYVLLKTHIPDLAGYKAKVSIDGTEWSRSFNEIPQERKLQIDITAAESAAMSLGYHETRIEITDVNDITNKIKGDTIFEVRRAEDED